MKKNILFLALFIFVLTTLTYLSLRPKTELVTQTQLPTQTPTPIRNIYVGAWVGGSWESSTKQLNVDVIKKFENLIDKKLAIINIYSDWVYLKEPSLLDDLGKVDKQGWTPMISSNPFFFDNCKKTEKSLYEAIANGDCDKFLEAVAVNLSNFKKPVMLRFAWEMNLPNMYWSVDKVGSKPNDFVKAWRRFYSITKKTAPNVIWVLSFNTSNSGTIPYKELYPGDDYVDWVAIDGYNWGNSHSWSGWASFDGTFRNSYDELTSLTKKPVMLSEVNSAPTGGDKTKWLKDMLEKQLLENYDNVRAIIIFNENKQSGESVDWRLEKSGDYIKSVKEGLRHEIYKSSYP